MTHQNTPAERQLLHFVSKLPLPEDVKTAWEGRIRSEGLSEELNDEIRARLVGDTEINGPERARLEIELARLARQWRMEAGAKKFGR
jgi:hypothetical protein